MTEHTLTEGTARSSSIADCSSLDLLRGGPSFEVGVEDVDDEAEAEVEAEDFAFN